MGCKGLDWSRDFFGEGGTEGQGLLSDVKEAGEFELDLGERMDLNECQALETGYHFEE